MRRSFALLFRVEGLIAIVFTATILWLVMETRAGNTTIRLLTEQLDDQRRDRDFPGVGESTERMAYRVALKANTVDLATLRTSSTRAIYFSSRACTACLLLEAELV